MKKKLARYLAFTVVALLGLVPIQAAPVAADTGGSLNVEPENVLRITNSIQRFTATVTPSAVKHIVFDDDDNPVTPPAAECDTAAATGKCDVVFRETSAAVITLRAYIEDAQPDPTAIPCNAATPGLPPDSNADADCTEGQNETTSPGVRSESPTPDDTDVVKVEFADGVLEVTPEDGTFTPSGPVKFTATVIEKTASGTPPVQRTLVANVDGEIESSTVTPSPGNKDKVPTKADLECNTDQATGKCDMTYTTGAAPGVDVLRFWVDLNDDPAATSGTPPVAAPTGDESSGAAAVYEADTTEQQVEAGAGAGGTAEPDTTDVVKASISATPILQASPVTQTKKTGETATITASATLAGAGENAKPIAAVVFSGPNQGKTATCNTGPGGTCNITYVGGATAGTDKVRLWEDLDSNGQPNEADASEDVGSDGATPDPDTTAVVQVVWTAPTPEPPPPPDGDNSKCEAAKTKLAKAKKALKKAKQGGDEDAIAKAKKKVKRAKKRKQAACA